MSERLIPAGRAAEFLGIDRHVFSAALRAGQVPGAIKISKRWYLTPAALRELLGSADVAQLEPPADEPRHKSVHFRPDD